MNVLLIDDHPLFRDGLALLLQPLMPGLVAWEAGSCEDAFALLDVRGPADLVLIDMALPGMQGLAGIAHLRARWPAMPVVALSSSDDPATVLQAIDAGAMGFIPKSSTSAVMLAALKLILARGIYLPPASLLGLRPAAKSPVDSLTSNAVQTGASTTPQSLGMSPRQCDVLYLILQGKPAKLIERELGLSAGTVKSHTSAVLRALNVTTRTQAVVAAGRLGLRFDRG